VAYVPAFSLHARSACLDVTEHGRTATKGHELSCHRPSGISALVGTPRGLGRAGAQPCDAVWEEGSDSSSHKHQLHSLPEELSDRHQRLASKGQRGPELAFAFATVAIWSSIAVDHNTQAGQTVAAAGSISLPESLLSTGARSQFVDTRRQEAFSLGRCCIYLQVCQLLYPWPRPRLTMPTWQILVRTRSQSSIQQRMRS
jgi:hypothetical protein